jgi:hypothetical protein
MDESEVREAIKILREGKEDYVGCCMFSDTLQKYDWIKPYSTVQFLNLKKDYDVKPETDFQDKLDAYLVDHQLAFEDILKKKDLRNACIKYFRQEMDCSLAKLGEVFKLSESSVSKIINS